MWVVMFVVFLEYIQYFTVCTLYIHFMLCLAWLSEQNFKIFYKTVCCFRFFPNSAKHMQSRSNLVLSTHCKMSTLSQPSEMYIT